MWMLLTPQLVQTCVIKCLDFWQYNRWKMIFLCSVLMYFSFFIRGHNIFLYKLIRTHSITSGRKLSLIWFKQQRRNKIHIKEKSVIVSRDRDTPWSSDSKDVIRSGFPPSLCLPVSVLLCLSPLSLCLALFSDGRPSCNGPRQHQAFILTAQVQHKDLSLILTDFTCITCLSLGHHRGQGAVLFHLSRPESQDHTPSYPCIYLQRWPYQYHAATIHNKNCVHPHARRGWDKQP